MNKYFSLAASLILALCSCSEPSDCSRPYEVKPIKLSANIVGLDIGYGVSYTIDILDGNGGYKVYQPKKIYLNGAEVDNDRSTMRVAVLDNNSIRIESLLRERVSILRAYLLVMDDKGEKALIWLKDTHAWLGQWDFAMLEDTYLYGDDFGDIWDLSVCY